VWCTRPMGRGNHQGCLVFIGEVMWGVVCAGAGCWWWFGLGLQLYVGVHIIKMQKLLSDRIMVFSYSTGRADYKNPLANEKFCKVVSTHSKKQKDGQRQGQRKQPGSHCLVRHDEIKQTSVPTTPPPTTTVLQKKTRKTDNHAVRTRSRRQSNLRHVGMLSVPTTAARGWTLVVGSAWLPRCGEAPEPCTCAHDVTYFFYMIVSTSHASIDVITTCVTSWRPGLHVPQPQDRAGSESILKKAGDSLLSS
jgi:hypothetical protein